MVAAVSLRNAARAGLAAFDRLPHRWRLLLRSPGAKGVAVALLLPAAIIVAFNPNPPVGIYLNGIVIGSLYGLGAMGLILVYRTNRVINFAHGAMGAVPAALALIVMRLRIFNPPEFQTLADGAIALSPPKPNWVAYLLGLLIVVVGSLAVGALVEFTLIRRFVQAPRIILTVATIGIAQLLNYVEVAMPGWFSGSGAFIVALKTPPGAARREIGGFLFTGDHLVAFVIVVALTAALAAFFRLTRIGIAARASAENSDRALLLGVPVRRVSTVVWALAALFAAMAAFLRAPTGGFGTLAPGAFSNPASFIFILTPAVIGRMQNLPLAFGAALSIGVIDQAAFYATRSSTISSVILLPLVLGALLLQRRSISRGEDTGVNTWQAVREFRPIPLELRNVREVVVLRWALRILVLALLLGAPYIVGRFRITFASLFLIYALVGLSLVVLTGWAGQISLGQFAFAGIGAGVAGGLAVDHGADFFLSIFVAGLVGSLVAVAVGVPALRIQGLFLAVTTLVFAVNTQTFFLNRQYFSWYLPEASDRADRPVIFGRIDADGDAAFYYVCLVVFAIAVLAVRSLRASHAGRMMVAARDNSRSAQSYGVNLSVVRLSAFAISGFLAAVAGALYVYLQRTLDVPLFNATTSLQMFTMAVIGGITSIPGSIAGALYVVVFQFLLPRYQLLVSGLGMLLLLLFFPGGLSEVAYRLRDAYLRRIAIARGIHVPSLLRDEREEPEPLATPSELPAIEDDEFAPRFEASGQLEPEPEFAPVVDASANGRSARRRAVRSGR